VLIKKVHAAVPMQVLQDGLSEENKELIESVRCMQAVKHLNSQRDCLDETKSHLIELHLPTCPMSMRNSDSSAIQANFQPPYKVIHASPQFAIACEIFFDLLALISCCSES
jgi:hypothetical protein